jgi:hypothetical protein
MGNWIKKLTGRKTTPRTDKRARPALEALESREVLTTLSSPLKPQVARDYVQFFTAVAAAQSKSLTVTSPIQADMAALRNDLSAGQAEKVVGDIGKLGQDLLFQDLLSPTQSLLSNSAVSAAFFNALLTDAVLVQYQTPGFGTTNLPQSPAPSSVTTNPWGYGTNFAPNAPGYSPIALFGNNNPITFTLLGNVYGTGIFGPSNTTNPTAALNNILGMLSTGVDPMYKL